MSTDFDVLKYIKKIFKVPISIYLEGTTKNNIKKLSRKSVLVMNLDSPYSFKLTCKIKVLSGRALVDSLMPINLTGSRWAGTNSKYQWWGDS